MKPFDGNAPETVVYIQGHLLTDLTQRDIYPNLPVAIRLENKKVLQVPYCWLYREENAADRRIAELERQLAEAQPDEDDNPYAVGATMSYPNVADDGHEFSEAEEHEFCTLCGALPEEHEDAALAIGDEPEYQNTGIDGEFPGRVAEDTVIVDDLEPPAPPKVPKARRVQT